MLTLHLTLFYSPRMCVHRNTVEYANREIHINKVFAYKERDGIRVW